ncbi:BTAD domain-containing putative transcriptional regulator [Lentzea sp. NPDC003310]|uniref:AfsR/SARP family transcriptional regulator n=1 Tax=Lentzea sp. NPDC003310 TaxID=3154447 RepID=UPI0033A6BDFF
MELRLLGAVLALVDGTVVDLGPARQRCVLAALAVDAGRVVSVDRLIDRVWGEHPPLRARDTLVNYVSRLRKVLVAGAVVRRSGGYSLQIRPAAIDLHRFRELCSRSHTEDDRRAAELWADALDLWNGEALTGVDGEWAEAERARLHRERRDAESGLADAVLRLGHGEDLVADLSARVAEHPLDERIAGQYLLALHRAGRTADALEHYRRLRERLVDELGTDPGPALRDVHRRVLGTDPGPAPRDVHGRVLATDPGPSTPDDPAVPRQLPAPPRRFVGRAAELSALDRGLGGSAAISGSGGIGKTWLALAWAHRHAHRFPDGQLFADLRGFGPGDPKQAADVLADFLAALGVDRDHQPQELDARAALYRTRTAGKRLLVLLDNAATADQVVPLLPGGDAGTVVVTSRNRLSALITRHGLRPVRLGVLADAEARTLLQDVLDDTQAAAELTALCGGFPLALGLVAARVSTHPDLLRDVVAELRDLGVEALRADDPNASLPAVLSWSLRHLTGEQRRVFGLLGSAPGPDVDLTAASVLTGLSTRDVRAALHALAEASLITLAAGGRCGMHDLVRAYAATTAPDGPEVRAAVDRVVDFYLDSACAADLLLDPHRDPARPAPPAFGVRPADVPAALAWLDTHHAHLLAAQRSAAAHGRQRTAWHLAWALNTFHWWRSHRHDDLAVWQVVVGSADRLCAADQVIAHRHLGMANVELGRREQAAALLNRALVLAEEHHDGTQQALTHHALTRLWESAGEYGQALEHARHALKLFRDLGQAAREAATLNTAGWFLACLGDHDTAREHCLAALALSRRHRDPDGESAVLDSLGWIEHHSGHHEQAVRYYREALALRRALGMTRWVASTLDHLGHPCAALGQADEARAAWCEAVELYREQGCTEDADRVQREIDELG